MAVADCIFILPYVQLPIYLFLYLSIYVSIYVYIYFPSSFSLSLLSLSLSLSLSSCLSSCISVCLSAAMLSDDREPNKIETKVTKTKTHLLFLSALSSSPSASLTVGVIRGPT